MPPTRVTFTHNPKRPSGRRSRFDAIPRRNRPQTLNQILRTSHLRQTVEDAITNRSDLQFLVHTFDTTIALQDAILRMPKVTPTIAFNLRPVLQGVESLQTATIYELLDQGVERRLGQIDTDVLDGRERPMGFLEASDSEDDANIARHVRAANSRLALIKQGISLMPCPTCDDHNHPPYQCPERARSPGPVPVPPPILRYSSNSSSSAGTPPPLMSVEDRPNSPYPNKEVIDLTICPNCGLDYHEDGPCPHTSVEDMADVEITVHRPAPTLRIICRNSEDEPTASDTSSLPERVMGEIQRAFAEIDEEVRQQGTNQAVQTEDDESDE